MIRPVLRNPEPRDFREVLHITFRTGLFGESLESTDFASDEYLFGLLYAYYYIRYEPENCFLAEFEGRIIGYVLGCDDSLRAHARFADLIMPKVNARAAELLATGEDDPEWVRHLLHSAADEASRALPDYVSRYPAHLHINVIPEFHRQGVGRLLIERELEHMRAAGIPGIHLVTTSANRKAVPFYESLGFTLLSSEPASAPWARIDQLNVLAFGLTLK